MPAKRAALLPVLLVLLLPLGGCGGGSSPSAGDVTTAGARTTGSRTVATTPGGVGKPTESNTTTCIAASPELRQRIAKGVILSGARLAKVEAVGAGGIPGGYFVSATVRGGGSPGKVATWFVHGLGGSGAVLAVDDLAATISTFGSSVSSNPAINATTRGAYRSRVCSGGPNVSPGQTAPPGGGRGGGAG